MTQEEKGPIRKIYDKRMEYPDKVLDIFNDFYGEDRVDMQGFLSFDAFVERILESRLGERYGSSLDVTRNSSVYKAMPDETRSVIDAILLDGSSFTTEIGKDPALEMYLSAILAERTPVYTEDTFIIVHFPHVRITNEHDRYVDVNHLWAKVGITFSGAGKGWFNINRSEYYKSHLRADYMHSHVNGIPFSGMSRFMAPCLGSGPIKSTLSTLAIGYDEPMWRLFCLELDRYMRTESLRGIPYRKLENISSGVLTKGEHICSMNFNLGFFSPLPDSDIMDFIRNFILGCDLRYNFINGSYGIAMPYTEFAIYASNRFIKWYNEWSRTHPHYTLSQLVSRDVLRKCKIDNGIIYEYRDGYSSYGGDCEEGEYILTFKGESVGLHIVDDDYDDPNVSYLLNNGFIGYLANMLVKEINYEYGKQQ